MMPKKFPPYLLYILLPIQILFFAPKATAQDTAKNNVDSIQSIPDTLLFKIQKAQAAITQINANNKKGYQVDVISDRLNTLEESIAAIKKEFENGKGKVETRGLINYQLVLKDGLTEVNALSAQLVKYNTELRNMAEQVVALSSDSLLLISAGDDNEKKLYASQLKDIKLRLQAAGALNGKSLDTVSRLLAKTSEITIVLNDLQVKLDDKLKASGKLALNKEVAYLWDAPLGTFNTKSIGEQITETIRGQSEILQYFIDSTWDKRTMLILLMAAFFIWVRLNFRYSQRKSVTRKMGELKFDYLRPWPVLATVILMICFAPFAQPDAPTIYIELLQLFMLLLITIHLWFVLPKAQLRSWFVVIAAFALLIVVANIASERLPMRLVLVGLNVFFIYLGLHFYRKVVIPQIPKKFFKFVTIALIVLNALAIILNIFGRVSLAKAFSTTGVVGLTQLLGLAVFIQIWLDAIELQFKVSVFKKGIFSRINQNKTKAKAKKFLNFICILLWITVLFINLSITSSFSDGIAAILAKKRTFGSINFTLGNVAYFTLIIYIANKLQKHIPLLFGEEQVSFDKSSGHRGSKVALFRLIVIVIGLLLAVTASGLPMDKLTVILGALGVGIGLGMQNIVNNFVSGIILIFERPFRIGDYIELVDKKGKVQDIGIRSSKLLTPQGSEVIIPNGDLLSGRLVNWTLSNDYLKSEIVFKVHSQSDLDAVRKTIENVVEQCDHRVSNLQPEISINSLGLDFVEFKVLTWITNVYVEAAFKTQLFSALLSSFKEQEIKVL